MKTSEAKIEKTLEALGADQRAQRVTDEGDAWLIIITKGSAERAVADRLRHQGFEVYLPMRLVEDERRAGRSRSAVPRPFMPRHVFARAQMNAARWQEIFTTVGVQRVLCDPRRPMGVRDTFIRRLREQEIDGYFKLGRHRKLTNWEPGQKVKVLEEAIDAVVREVVDGRRVMLLASLFNSDSIRITVSLR
jgi:transcription antitermination factor NusG